MPRKRIQVFSMLACAAAGIVMQQKGAAAQNNTWELSSRFTASSSRAVSNVRTYPAAEVPYAPGAGAPAWFAIQGQGEPVKTQAYWSSNPAWNSETPASYTDFGHTPFLIAFQPPAPTAAETSAGGCPVADRPQDGVYFYDTATQQYIGNRNPPVYPDAGPSEITTSPADSGVRGFAVNSYILGGVSTQSPKGSYAIAATYLTGNNNPCAAADQEMGLWVNLIDADRKIYFDISDYTNCNGLGNCRTNPNGWEFSSPITQADNIIWVTNPVTYEGTYTNLFYEMYLIPVGTAGSPVASSQSGYALRIAVVDGNHTDRFATCNINGNPTPVACTADIPLQWTPARAAQMINGGSNLVNATATSYPTAPVGLYAGNIIQGLWLGR
jgi:hypothetical protein